MTTARDLLTVTMDMPTRRPVDRGDLSLALAGAELADLLRLGAAAVEDGRIVPGEWRGDGDRDRDRLLDEAAAALRGTEPYETVEDWLWRRGRGLAAAYLAAFTDEGRLVRQRERRWLVFGSSRMVLAESAGRRRAAHRWAAEEPVLVALATGVGVAGHQPDPMQIAPPDPPDDLTPPPPAGPPPDLTAEVRDPSVAAVLCAVAAAVAELSAERRRRANRLKDAHATTLRRGY